MHRFWGQVIRPMLEAVKPQSVVEIGAAGGAHTRLLAEHANAHGWVLHSIDPQPRFNPAELPGVVFHRRGSLDALGDIGAVDVALVDGDHNWYTVNSELRLLQETAHAAGRPTPVIACHDVCWPYGRRDLYYDPEAIPLSYRREWKRAGIVRGRSELVSEGGLNPHLCNAVREGGDRNGVMTAIEDFAGSTDEDFDVEVLPVLWGLGILAPRARLDSTPALGELLARWRTTEGLADLAALAERDRERLERTVQALTRKRDSQEAAPELERGTPAVQGRPFSSELAPGSLASIQRGVLETRWRGVRFLKSPFDIALYAQLIESLMPRTVIEIGSKEGGSALWFADMLASHGIDGTVVSIDREEPPELDDPRIDFLRGDAMRLGETLDEARMSSLPHPLLVVEDSAHTYETSTAVLDFFHPFLRSGDYIVVEDGIVSQLPGDAYRRYEDGPNRAVSAFLERHPDEYVIDADLCDRYGHNVTWSPNAWLRRE